MVKILKHIIEQVADKHFEAYSNNFDHETEENYVPYGDTYVSSGSYITDRSIKNCVEHYKDDFDIDDFLDELKEDDAFRDIVKKIVLKHLEALK